MLIYGFVFGPILHYLTINTNQWWSVVEGTIWSVGTPDNPHDEKTQ
tara:strand:- start:1062 stop:1199 length:138 start_codon:yes stop_codon:yes gene_type:complete